MTNEFKKWRDESVCNLSTDFKLEVSAWKAGANGAYKWLQDDIEAGWAAATLAQTISFKQQAIIEMLKEACVKAEKHHQGHNSIIGNYLRQTLKEIEEMQE